MLFTNVSHVTWHTHYQIFMVHDHLEVHSSHCLKERNCRKYVFKANIWNVQATFRFFEIVVGHHLQEEQILQSRAYMGHPASIPICCMARVQVTQLSNNLRVVWACHNWVQRMRVSSFHLHISECPVAVLVTFVFWHVHFYRNVQSTSVVATPWL
jgi:hypothetical protein